MGVRSRRVGAMSLTGNCCCCCCYSHRQRVSCTRKGRVLNLSHFSTNSIAIDWLDGITKLIMMRERISVLGISATFFLFFGTILTFVLVALRLSESLRNSHRGSISIHAKNNTFSNYKFYLLLKDSDFCYQNHIIPFLSIMMWKSHVFFWISIVEVVICNNWNLRLLIILYKRDFQPDAGSSRQGDDLGPTHSTHEPKNLDQWLAMLLFVSNEDVSRDFPTLKILTTSTETDTKPIGARGNHGYHYTTGNENIYFQNQRSFEL